MSGPGPWPVSSGRWPVSNSALTKVFSLGTDVKGARRLVLLVLADYADDEGYSYPKISTIALRAGLEREETVREHLSWLEGEGLIERIVNGWAGVRGQIPVGKRPNLYRLTLGPRIPGGQGPRETGGQGPTESVGQNPHDRSPRDPTSPTPPEPEGEAADAAPQLFVVAGAVTADERKRRADPEGDARAVVFDEWYRRYPSGRKGSKPAALRAFRRALREGATMSDLDRQLGHYEAARVAYRARWSVDAPLMNASTFLNGKRALWDTEWGPDDLPYWPAPAGWEWSDAPVMSHDTDGVDEIPAEIRAQGVRAMGRWMDERKAAVGG